MIETRFMIWAMDAFSDFISIAKLVQSDQTEHSFGKCLNDAAQIRKKLADSAMELCMQD